METNRDSVLSAGHQGDVQFFSVEFVPQGYVSVDKTFFARSEKTGHIHVLCGDYELYQRNDLRNGRFFVQEEDDDSDVVVADSGSDFIVVVGERGAVLNHASERVLEDRNVLDMSIAVVEADHRPIFFKKGIYRIGIQRRLNPFSGFFESVVD